MIQRLRCIFGLHNWAGGKAFFIDDKVESVGWSDGIRYLFRYSKCQKCGVVTIEESK